MRYILIFEYKVVLDGYAGVKIERPIQGMQVEMGQDGTKVGRYPKNLQKMECPLWTLPNMGSNCKNCKQNG